MNVRNITLGLYGGLAGGVVFGAMMATMGMLPMMGMGLNWNAAAASQMLPSLVGHLVYGALLGTTYVWLKGHGTHPVHAVEEH